MGLGMMICAIIWTKENGKKYIYLGSASRPSDTYKFQFAGVEWFDGKKWSRDIELLKNVLSS
jgi:arginyl-tRNA--protein-N-Asp/Glu arginylyltransferase